MNKFLIATYLLALTTSIYAGELEEDEDMVSVCVKQVQEGIKDVKVPEAISDWNGAEQWAHLTGEQQEPRHTYAEVQESCRSYSAKIEPIFEAVLKPNNCEQVFGLDVSGAMGNNPIVGPVIKAYRRCFAFTKHDQER